MHLTYAGEVSRFENRVRKQVDPAQLQQWAIATLVRYSTSQVQNASFGLFTDRSSDSW